MKDRNEKHARMIELLDEMGLGPRACVDCGKVFSVPPYADCANWKYCDSCASRRLLEWARTEDGQKELSLIKERNKYPDNFQNKTITVIEARNAGRCRVCREKIVLPDGRPVGWEKDFAEMLFPEHIVLDFGLEFAHAKCLPPKC